VIITERRLEKDILALFIKKYFVFYLKIKNKRPRKHLKGNIMKLCIKNCVACLDRPHEVLVCLSLDDLEGVLSIEVHMTAKKERIC